MTNQEIDKKMAEAMGLRVRIRKLSGSLVVINSNPLSWPAGPRGGPCGWEPTLDLDLAMECAEKFALKANLELQCTFETDGTWWVHIAKDFTDLDDNIGTMSCEYSKSLTVALCLAIIAADEDGKITENKENDNGK